VLRKVLIGFFAAAFLLGLVLRLGGDREASTLTIWAGLMLVAVLAENWRYRKRSRPGEMAPDAGWVVTDERFVDPESGAVMRVYYHQGSGERRYEKSTETSPEP